MLENPLVKISVRIIAVVVLLVLLGYSVAGMAANWPFKSSSTPTPTPTSISRMLTLDLNNPHKLITPFPTPRPTVAPKATPLPTTVTEVFTQTLKVRVSSDGSKIHEQPFAQSKVLGTLGKSTDFLAIGIDKTHQWIQLNQVGWVLAEELAIVDKQVKLSDLPVTGEDW